jgi:hypothetical protein
VLADEDQGVLIDDDSLISTAPQIPSAAKAPTAPTAHENKAAQDAASSSGVKVQIVETDSDDEDDDSSPSLTASGQGTDTCASQDASKDATQAKVAPVPWDPQGRDERLLTEAKKLKEEGDTLFKKSLFDKAAETYSAVLQVLGEADEYSCERTVCYNNRAACRFQIRDFPATIADCNEVLAGDSANVKALVRRALSYENLERCVLVICVP